MDHIANEVISNLWIGDWRSMLDTDWLVRRNIRTIINCTKHERFVEDSEIPRGYGAIKRIRVPVDDNFDPNESMTLYSMIGKIVDEIDSARGSGGVLVHCYAGVQRSFAVICAYLMRYAHIPKRVAVAAVRSKRPIAGRPGINFEVVLDMYEKDLRRVSSRT